MACIYALRKNGVVVSCDALDVDDLADALDVEGWDVALDDDCLAVAFLLAIIGLACKSKATSSSSYSSIFFFLLSV